MSYNSNDAFLVGKVYKINEANKGNVYTSPSGNRWLVIDTTPDGLSTGYQGALVKNLDTGKYELVSRGTEFDREPLKDGGADLQMGLGKLPNQVESARDFLAQARVDIFKDGGNPNTDLSLSGHSLGGSITQILAAENPQLPAVAFNPYGVGNLIPAGDYPNVTNHVMAQDLVSVLPGSKMIGSTTMYTEPGNRGGDTALTLNSHFANNFLQPEVLAQNGKSVTIDVTPNALKPLEPITLVNPVTEINEGRLDPNTLLPKQPTSTATTNPNHSTDYNFPDTAGAGRGTVNPEPATPTPRAPSTTFVNTTDAHTAVLSSGGTLSDIALLQKNAGNPISVDDLRQANPALHINADASNVPAGVTLNIPTRSGDNLTIHTPDGGSITINTKTAETTTLTPTPTGGYTQVVSTTDGEFTRTEHSTTFSPSGQVLQESSVNINTIDGTRTSVPTPHTEAATDTAAQQVADAFAQSDQTAAGIKAQYPNAVHVADASDTANTPGTATDAGTSPSTQATTAADSAATQAQATALFNSLMATGQWDHLSGLGKLSALANLYNATDHLGQAFDATGDNLPGDLGQAAGWLSIAQGLERGDALILANGINIVSDRALDSALGEAFGSASAAQAGGQAVPYVSYALAVRNFDEHPEQALLTVAGTYAGEAANDQFSRSVA